MRGLGALNSKGEKMFSLKFQVVDRTMIVDYVELLIKKEGATRIHLSVNPDPNKSGTWLVNWNKEDKGGVDGQESNNVTEVRGNG